GGRRRGALHHQGRGAERGRAGRHRIARTGFSSPPGGARREEERPPLRETPATGGQVPKSYMAVEPRVRRVVAASLGCDVTSLGPGTALRLDPITLLDVAQALENAFGVTLTEGGLDRVCSCRDFASLCARRVARSGRAEAPAAGPVWVRVIPAEPGGPLLERLVELTPYMIETIDEDARVPGRYRRLEVILGPGQPDRVAAQVEAVFAPARAAGLVVEVHREGRPRLPRVEPA